MSPIKADNLWKAFGHTKALNGLSLTVAPGSIYGLLGRNGAGKTTLLKILIGLLRPDSGTAHVLGHSLSDGVPKEKAQVAYVAQDELLPPWASATDLMRFDAAVRPQWNADALLGWMAREGIDARRSVGALSAGQRKRVELELALAGRPSVLLLDEPFAGLDPVSRAEFIEALIAHTAESDATILLSSHILTDLERLCDHVGFLVGGVLRHEEQMDALKSRGDQLEDVGVELLRSLEEQGSVA
jgi:ABC-2 type transport system ATP-binding protein